MVGTVVHEKGWFADDAGVIIGAVTFDVTDEDWGYVVLESDEDGLFRGIDVEVSLLSREEATTKLSACMREHADRNKTT